MRNDRIRGVLKEKLVLSLGLSNVKEWNRIIETDRNGDTEYK